VQVDVIYQAASDDSDEQNDPDWSSATDGVSVNQFIVRSCSD